MCGKFFTAWALELVKYRNTDVRNCPSPKKGGCKLSVLSVLSARGQLTNLPPAIRPRIGEHHITRPLFIPRAIATELGARPLDYPQYRLEDRRLARTARDGPLQRVPLDRCQFVVGGIPS
jgi:hypothetical protein